MANDRERWDARYRERTGESVGDPTPALRRWRDALPSGRALDVATGRGRNALFLAERGYEVDAVDVSGEALSQARARAEERDLDVNWVQADLTEYPFPSATYDVVVVSFYATLDRLPDLKEALAPGGVLVYEHHLRSATPVDRGPRTDRYRFRSNDLLRACLDLTVLSYAERVRRTDGRAAAVVTLVARNSTGGAQQYPEVANSRPDHPERDPDASRAGPDA